MHMKKFFAVLMLILVFTCRHGTAFAKEGTEELIEEGIYEVLNELDFDSLGELYDSAGRPLGKESVEEVLAKISEEGLSFLTAEELINSLFGAAFASVKSIFPIVLELAAVILVSGLASGGGEMRKELGLASRIFSALIICGIAASGVKTVLDSLETVSYAVEIAVPVNTALLMILAQYKTSAVLNPLLSGLCGGAALFIKNAILPILSSAQAFNLADGVSEKKRFGGFVSLICDSAKWMLGIVSAVFLAIGTVNGLLCAKIDSVSLKTARYAIDKSVPVIGAMLSDSFDTFMACGGLIRNSVGIMIMAVLLALMLRPLMRLFLNMLVLRISSAMAELFGGEGTAYLLSGAAKVQKLLLIASLAVFTMAFLIIAVFMGVLGGA